MWPNCDKRLDIALFKGSHSHTTIMAITVDEPTLVDSILFYGLFLGAIFQIVCILSVVFVPKSTEEQVRNWFRQNIVPVDIVLLHRRLGPTSLTYTEFNFNSSSTSKFCGNQAKNPEWTPEVKLLIMILIWFCVHNAIVVYGANPFSSHTLLFSYT